MYKPRIIIKIEGGIVQEIYSNTDIEVIVVDFDVHNEENTVTIELGKQDKLFKTGHSSELFEFQDEEVENYLKTINF